MEETGVVDGHGRLIGEAGQQVAVGVAEDTAGDAVVGIENADGHALQLERRAEDGAQLVADDALLGGEALVFLGIDGDDGFARLGHAAHNTAADVQRTGAERLLRQVAGHLHFQHAVVVQQQHGPLGPRQAHDGIHDLLQHDVQIEGGVDSRADLGQCPQAALLAGLDVEIVLQLAGHFAQLVQLAHQHGRRAQRHGPRLTVGRAHQHALLVSDQCLQSLDLLAQVGGADGRQAIALGIDRLSHAVFTICARWDGKKKALPATVERS